MPPEAMMVRSSKLRSMTGSMTGCPHFLHSWVAKGAKSPEMNVLALQRPHITIFNGLAAPVASLLTNSLYHQSTARQVSLVLERDMFGPELQQSFQPKRQNGSNNCADDAERNLPT